MAWASLALWFDGPSWRPLAGLLAAGFVAAAVALVGLVRPMRRSFALLAVLWFVVLIWWLSIAPRNDRDWEPDVARPAGVPLATLAEATVANTFRLFRLT